MDTSQPTRESRQLQRQVRELNKVCRSVYEKNGEDYGPDVDEEHLKEKVLRARKLCNDTNVRIIKSLEEVRSVQLCILMDVTGSMKSHIQEVLSCINKIVDTLHNKCLTAIAVQNLEVAFVGYRDIKDERRFEILDFVTDIEEFKRFCSKVEATGGGDPPEDVFGGFVKATKLKWRPDYGTHVLFHMCDCPCHGKEYHEDNLRDDYPDGDPEGNNINDIFREIDEKSIDYYFGKITNYTDIMINKFSEIYRENVLYFDVREVANICTSVINSVEGSLLKKMRETTVDVKPNHRRKPKFDDSIPNWKELETIKCPCLSYKVPTGLSDIIHNIPLERSAAGAFMMKIAPNPFAHGAERLAYYGLDVRFSEEKEIVLKEMLDDTKKSVDYEMSAQCQTIAQFMAQEFNKIHGEPRNIIFLEARVVQIEPNRFMTVERKFVNPVFVRFQNNADYKIEKAKADELGVGKFVDLVMAFSHWTGFTTNGEVMIVDIEGIVDNTTGDLYVTDPAILSKDPVRFPSMNRSLKGMELFFSTHDCNPICRRLKLKHPKDQKESWLLEAAENPLDSGTHW